MPLLFVIAFSVLSIQYVLDKLLITYYYSYRYEFDDELAKKVYKDLINSVFFFLFFGSLVLFYNNYAVKDSS
jgi:hypothetical protein